MNKCHGCGIKLQYDDSSLPGYTPKKEGKLCQRCFKITNYNSHDIVAQKLDNNLIIEGINKQKCATMFLCDILNLNSDVMKYFNKINNPKILVVTKSDIIPKNIKLSHLEENIKSTYGIDDLIFVSSLSGYGKRNILEYIDYYGKVVFAGPTSSGKSSLINYLFDSKLTVSNHKNTTQDFYAIKHEDNLIVDAPGFNEDYLGDLHRQSGYIIPKTMILKKEYVLDLENINIATKEDVSVALFFPKDLIYKTKKNKNLNGKEINIPSGSDLILDNLGFIYFKKTTKIMLDGDCYYDIRKSIVGGKNDEN